MTVADKPGAGTDRSADAPLRPIWDIGQNALMAFRPELPDMDAGSGPLQDMASLASALKVIQRRDQKGQITLALLPVDARLIRGSAARDKLLKTLEVLPEQLWKRLVIEIQKVPATRSAEELRELLLPLAQRCRGIIGLAPIDARGFSFFREAGAFATGIDLRTDIGRGEAELMDRMAVFVERAKSAKLKVIVHGVDTRSLAISAVCAGVSFISGEAVHGVVSSPTGAIRFNPAHLVGLDTPEPIPTLV